MPPFAAFYSSFLLRYQQGPVHYLFILQEYRANSSTTTVLAVPCTQSPKAYTRMEMRINFMSILQLEKEDTVRCPRACKGDCWSWVRRS